MSEIQPMRKDMTTPKLINPTEQKREELTVRRIKNMDGVKYYSRNQIKLFRRVVREKAELANLRKNKTAIKEWAAVDLLTCTGVRVGELTTLRCGDIQTGYGESSIYIRDGKGGRSRTIEIPSSLKTHLNNFLKWKKEQGEHVNEDALLFIGQRGAWSVQAVQALVKKHLKLIGIYQLEKSVHALRHSYAVELYRKCKNLRIVQKQLGHASITTTQIYADVTREDIQKQIVAMWAN